MHGTTIESGVILMACQPKQLPDGTWSQPEYLQFEVGPEEFAHWSNEWMKRVEQYYQVR